MQQPIRLPLFFLVLFLHGFTALGQQMWTNPKATMETFGRFIGCLKQSGTFLPEQMDDLDMITEAFNMQKNKMGDRVPEHKLKAMTMGLAGSIAETAASSPNGVSPGLMDSIDNCLTGSMLQVTGTVDQLVRSEILKIIKLINDDERNLVSTSASGFGSGYSAGVGIVTGAGEGAGVGAGTGAGAVAGYGVGSSSTATSGAGSASGYGNDYGVRVAAGSGTGIGGSTTFGAGTGAGAARGYGGAERNNEYGADSGSVMAIGAGFAGEYGVEAGASTVSDAVSTSGYGSGYGAGVGAAGGAGAYGSGFGSAATYSEGSTGGYGNSYGSGVAASAGTGSVAGDAFSQAFAQNVLSSGIISSETVSTSSAQATASAMATTAAKGMGLDANMASYLSSYLADVASSIAANTKNLGEFIQAISNAMGKVLADSGTINESSASSAASSASSSVTETIKTYGPISIFNAPAGGSVGYSGTTNGGYVSGVGDAMGYGGTSGTATSLSAAASSGAGIVTSNRYGYGTSDTSRAYGGALSRLASPEALNRMSSNIGSFVSNGSSALSNVLPSIFSEVSTSAAGATDAEILIQTLLELISILVHILSYSTIGFVDSMGIDSSLSAVNQAIMPIVG